MILKNNSPKVLPGGLNLSRIPPFRSACGARVVDSAGTSYLDLISGYGTVVAGHAHERIKSDVVRALSSGNYMYGHHELIGVLADRLTALFPGTTDAHFFKTGSEAVQCATRLARAATHKERILRCGFHGWHDQFMTENVRWHDFDTEPVSRGKVAGVPTALASLVTRVRCDESSLAAEFEKGEVAALILDPVQLVPPFREQLEVAQTLCKAHDALLVIDESKTGFRVSQAGVQGLVGLYGDITVLSKALANGFPLAAVLTSDNVRMRSTGTKIMGTYNYELLSLVASNATLDVILESEAWHRLNELGEWLLATVNQGLASVGCNTFSLSAFRWPCMPILTHSKQRKDDVLPNAVSVVAQKLLEQSILWLPHHMNFLSLAHDHESLGEFVQRLIPICLEVERAWPEFIE